MGIDPAQHFRSTCDTRCSPFPHAFQSKEGALGPRTNFIQSTTFSCAEPRKQPFLETDGMIMVIVFFDWPSNRKKIGMKTCLA